MAKKKTQESKNCTDEAAFIDTIATLLKDYRWRSIKAAFDTPIDDPTYKEKVTEARRDLTDEFFAPRFINELEKRIDMDLQLTVEQDEHWKQALEHLRKAYILITSCPEEAKKQLEKFENELQPLLATRATKNEVTEAVKSLVPYYHMLVQGKTSNKLQKKITERITGEQATQLDLWGNGSIADRDFKLYVRGYSELLNGVNQSAARLLDSLMITATKEGLSSTLIKLPLRDYMEMRGLRDKKDTRAQVRRDIDALERISFEYKGTGKNRGAWLKVSIAGGTVGQIKNGDIIFRFNQDWYDSFKASETGKYMYMYFPREALRTNINSNPWTYWLARKISEHKRMNLGKANEDVIAVNTLIEACPNFPTYDDVISSDRAVSRRIIEPFERDMDVLTESLSWHYTEEAPTDYKTFMAATVTIHWNDYPDTSNLITQKAQRTKRETARNRSKKT